jgi:cystathionine gamma-synthase
MFMASTGSENGMKAETIAARGLHGVENLTGAIVPPLYSATTYARDSEYIQRGDSIYLRFGNPTIDLVEQFIAALEGGAEARIFSSGMAAIVTLLETLPVGAHVVAPKVMYHGTLNWLRRLEKSGRISTTFFEPADPEGISEALKPGKTGIVWVETPINPVWDVIDIADAARFAHRAGARLVVDSTVATPVLTRPLSLGADIVVHSATKYLNGHSDVLGGVLVTAARDPEWDEIDAVRDLMGNVLAPHEAWMLARGLRTLFVRVRQACATALFLAKEMERHPKIAGVLYPGLPSHPAHNIAARQMSGGFGGMLSLLLDADEKATLNFVKNLNLFLPATSLGSVESLAEHRRTIEGESSPVPSNLVRLSIGLEAPEDLLSDLNQALART